MTSPSDVCSRLTAQPRDLRGQRGQPVGLVAAQVRDAAQPGGGVGQGGERRDGRRDLAGRVQVEVDPVHRAGAGHAQHVAVEPSGRRPCAPGSRGSRPPGCVVCAGQPGTRHRAAGRRAPRTGTVPRWTGRARRARRGRGSARATPARSRGASRRPRRRPRGAARPSSRCAAGSAACGPVCRSVSPRVEPCGGEQQRRRRTGSTPTRRCRPGRRRPQPRPCTVNGRCPGSPCSSTRTPSVRSAVEHRAHRARASAESSPSNRTGPSASAATAGRKRITVPASPQWTVVGPAHRAGGDHPVAAVLVDPRRPRPASAAAISTGVARAQRRRAGDRGRRRARRGRGSGW